MNVLEARRRLLDGEIKKWTAEGENISVRSVSRMKPGLTLYGKSEQRTTTGAQLNNGNMSNLIGSTTGVIVSSLSNVSIIIPIQGEEDYTISYKNGEKAITFHCTTEEYPAEGVEIVDVFTGSSGIQVPEKTMHTSSRAKYLVINVSSDESELIKNAMLNLGTTALPWEPYTGGKPSPSPNYPQEIKSVGDSGTVNVTLSDGESQSQTLPVQTPNGLPGIPVSSGGNYTDANGQQWICDEVDFKRGVYVQRVGKYNFEQGKTVRKNLIASTESLSRCYFSLPGKKINGTSAFTPFFCNIFKNEIGIAVNSLPENTCIWEYSENIYICVASSWGDETQISQKLYDLGAKFVYLLENPIETPLSPSDLAAYAALRTYSPTTVVSNDAGAWMKLGYKTKKSLEVTD